MFAFINLGEGKFANAMGVELKKAKKKKLKIEKKKRAAYESYRLSLQQP